MSGTIGTSNTKVYTPYYTAIPNSCKPSYMTDEQFGKQGYMYNWAAVVGLSNGTSQSTAFTGNRQGLCPNGWHIPSVAEWNTLRDKLGGGYIAGKKMKSSTGWKSGGYTGEDDYGLMVLPAGYAEGSYVGNVGSGANYDLSDATNTYSAYGRTLSFDTNTLIEGSGGKEYAYSVRCIQ